MHTDRYRLALLDYLTGKDDERSLVYAYEFGRKRIHHRAGLLQIVRVHQKALRSILQAAPADKRLHFLLSSEEFLMEALSSFEMTSRGYVALVQRPPC